uniref:Uncharacterized protein n=1 Tax=Oryza glaberrima TaxID=4538 RepID=I1Q9P5_ORYGL
MHPGWSQGVMLTPRYGSCVATERSSYYVLTPATGAVYNLPVNPAEEHVYHVQLITCTDLTLICIWACCFHGRVQGDPYLQA